MSGQDLNKNVYVLYENQYRNFHFQYTLICDEGNGMCYRAHFKDKIHFYKYYAGLSPISHEFMQIPVHKNLPVAKGNLKEISEYIFKDNPEFLI